MSLAACKLAERATSATQEIARIVQITQRETTNAVIAANTGSQQAKSSQEKIDASLDDALKMEQIASSVQGFITTSVDISTQNSAVAEEVATATTEVTHQVQDVNVATHELEAIAVKLAEAITIFQLEMPPARIPPAQEHVVRQLAA